MLNHQTATAFANSWISAFNSHNPDLILEHYSDRVLFASPFVQYLHFNEQGVIHNKQHLRSYFETGLKASPDLHFQLQHVYAGINSVVICYLSVNSKMAAETFVLDDTLKATQVFCHYI